MIFYKQMTKEQVIEWWSKLSEIPTKEKKEELLDGDVIYAVISKLDHSPEQKKEFVKFYFTLTKEFTANEIENGVTEFIRQNNNWTLSLIHIFENGVKSPTSGEWVIIEQDKLTFVEKVFGHKFLNQRFMSTIA